MCDWYVVRFTAASPQVVCTCCVSRIIHSTRLEGRGCSAHLVSVRRHMVRDMYSSKRRNVGISIRGSCQIPRNGDKCYTKCYTSDTPAPQCRPSWRFPPVELCIRASTATTSEAACGTASHFSSYFSTCVHCEVKCVVCGFPDPLADA